MWNDTRVRSDLKVRLVKSLVWPVITFGVEGSTLKKHEELRIQAVVMCRKKLPRR